MEVALLFMAPVVGLVWTWREVFQYGLDDMAIIVTALLLATLIGMLACLF